MRALYLLAAYLLAPLLVLHWLWRSRREPGYRADLPERFGFGATTATGGLWIHAVSAGEVQAAVPLVARLRAADPAVPILVTTATPAGRSRARALLAGVDIRYAPIDLPGAVRRFYARTRPRVLVVLETELWPTLYAGARRRRIPIVVASARLSERSVRRYRRLGGFVAEVLSGVTVAAQTELDARRFVELGADPARVHVVGNLKFDYAPAPEVAVRAGAWRDALGRGRFVWIAGSTHPVEEDIILAAHTELRRTHPDALLILAPRHPPRFAAVAAALSASGATFVVRDSPDAPPPEAPAPILLLATLGELACAYAAGDVAFVGGTLVPVGGHNLLEPAAAARPVLFGPSHDTARAMATVLLDAGGGAVVDGAPALAGRLRAYCEDPVARRNDGAAAAAAVAANQGAGARIAVLVASELAGGAAVGER